MVLNFRKNRHTQQNRLYYSFVKLRKVSYVRIFRVFLVIISVLFTLPLQAKRIALVIGNDNYIAVSKLQKAGNDATAMARELRSAGFAVQLHQNLNYRATVKAVENFANGISGGDEVVVFYAGHGVQIKNGSYLLPTDIEVNSESEVEKTAYDLLTLTEKLADAKPAFSLVIIDACRDNPLRSKGRSIGNARRASGGGDADLGEPRAATNDCRRRGGLRYQSGDRCRSGWAAATDRGRSGQRATFALIAILRR